MGVEEGDVGVEEGAIDCWASEGALDPPPPPYPVYWSLNMIFLNIVIIQIKYLLIILLLVLLLYF